jgi:hypothetical protein
MPKFIVITVGLEIGVFENWSLAGPYVKGPGLEREGPIWQGFTSREEAERVFAEAQRRGITRRIVLGGSTNSSASTSEPPDASPRNARGSTRRTAPATTAAQSSHARASPNPRPIPISPSSSSRARRRDGAQTQTPSLQTPALRAHHSAPVVIPPSVFASTSRSPVRAHNSSPAVVSTESRPRSRRAPSDSCPISITIHASEPSRDIGHARRSNPRREQTDRSRRSVINWSSMSTLEDPPTDVTQCLPGGYDESLFSSSSRRNNPNRTRPARTSNIRWRNIPSPPTNVTQSIPEDAVFDDESVDDLTEPDIPGSLPPESPGRSHTSGARQLSLADRRRQSLQQSIEASAAWARSVAQSTTRESPSLEHHQPGFSGLLSPLSEPIRLIARTVSVIAGSSKDSAPPSVGASRRSTKRRGDAAVTTENIQSPPSRSSRAQSKQSEIAVPTPPEDSSEISGNERASSHSASRPHSMTSTPSIRLCSNCRSPVSSRHASASKHEESRRSLIREESTETVTSASRSKHSSRRLDRTSGLSRGETSDVGRTTPPGFGPGATDELSCSAFGLFQLAHSGVTVLDNAADPRSPMRGDVRVPATGSESIRFARLSPSVGVDGLGEQMKNLRVHK